MLLSYFGSQIGNFSVHDLGHYFEFFAGLSLAYSGLDVFRRKVFEILSALFTPQTLQPAYNSVSAKAETLKVIFGEQWSQKFLEKKAKIEAEHEQTRLALAAEDEEFLSDIRATRPLFLCGFLFCFNNLIVIGYEQFLVKHSVVLTEQWLCISALIMLLINRESAAWLRHHVGVIISSMLLLVIGLMIGMCPYEFAGIPYSGLLTCTLAVLVPLVPFLLDYRAVQLHVQQRNSTMSQYIDDAKAELAGLDTAAEVLQDFHDEKDEPDSTRTRKPPPQKPDIFI